MPKRSNATNKSRRPTVRRPRRSGPRGGKLVRVQLQAGGTKFPLSSNIINGVDQGNRFIVPLSKIMPPTDSSAGGFIPQDAIRADSRLVGIKVIFPPIGNAQPSGFDVLVRGVPNMPRLGALVGRTRQWLDRNRPTHLTCRLPLSVTSYYIEDPVVSPVELVFQQRIALSSGEPSTNDFPPFILELRFHEQPIETLVL